MQRLRALVASQRRLLADYASAISGSAGRLVFSLAYFMALANTLPIAEFGLFATASAAGVMLSRILSFGFISALYRTATVRPKLIGTYTAGFLLLAAASLPFLALGSGITYALFFSREMAFLPFALIIVAEALLWRPVEVVIIVNNGQAKFGRAAFLVILGTALRALAAVIFVLTPYSGLGVWIWFYLAANAASLLIAVIFYYPRQRLRLHPALYWRRLVDSIYVAGAEMLFYIQAELDKLLVLSLGGAHLAGIYAIIMRLVDLTALPIRAFSMMLVQKLMRAPQLLARSKVKIALETGVFAVSTLALLTLAIMLWFVPNLLGNTVAEVTPFIALAMLIPGLRNLVEYQNELLFARGLTLLRVGNLALLTILKGGMLWLLLTLFTDPQPIIIWLNAVFVVLYLTSALITYSAMRRPARKI
ncbi:lipopolysaccharide biosynthesis protein [Limoniibacter endophyticus]|uniref:Transporter n=1 Tax=Limoniibacter endophyticus TaxID=1565040 RepID=A0A8J3DQT7_9HYPH|nr:lipopolysaccharide biosynthesis protein [Limoniibacter endophyticus]GHC67623.1 transporter [Limoniibacter endophyticus]